MYRIWALFLVSVFTSISSIQAQQPSQVIEGVVLADDETNLAGVRITWGEEGRGVLSDARGHFKIALQGSTKRVTLHFSCIGFRTQSKELRLPLSQPLRIVMKEAVTELQTVVITAKSNINEINIREKSGVVARVDMKTLQSKPMSDFGLALQGSVPGLVVINTGELGSKPQIRLRGNSSFRPGDISNEPLYVLDGKVIPPETFSLLQPQDIESVVVLKDAIACALYGIKAANGVLEITSKKGYKGPLTLNYSTDIGISFRGNRTLKMMGTAEKLEYERRIMETWTPGYLLSDDYLSRDILSNIQEKYSDLYGIKPLDNKEAYSAIAKALRDSIAQYDTDWFDKLMKTTLYTNHHLSARGGDDDISYYTSVGISSQQGQLPGVKRETLSGRMGFDKRLGKMGIVSLEAGGSYGSSTTPNGATFQLTELVYNLNPYETPTSDYLYSYKGRKYSDLFGQYNSHSTTRSANTSLSFNLQPVDGLMLAGIIGGTLLVDDAMTRVPGSSYEEQKSGAAKHERGYITKSKSSRWDLTTNFRATYNKTFVEKHDITMSVNYDYYLSSYESLGAKGYGTGELDFLSSANMSIEGYRKPTFSNQSLKDAQRGLGIALGYSYGSLSDLYASYKIDQSSILPKGKRSNSAWSLGAGLHLAPLLFPNTTWLNELSIRASYGHMANISGITAAETIPIFAYTQRYYADRRELQLQSMYNANLRAEQTKSIDLGISTKLFGKTTLSLQWYHRAIFDALLDVPLALSHGHEWIKKNVGILSNRGIEISCAHEIIATSDWYASIYGNIAYNKNKVISLYDSHTIYSSEESFAPLYKEGESYSTVYGWTSLGINPLTGYPTVQTADGGEKSLVDGLTPEDIRPLGLSTPKATGALGFNVRYKSIEANGQLYYTLGGVKSYSFTYVRQKGDAMRNAPAGLLEQTWFAPGDDNKIYPSPNLAGTSAYSSFLMYNNSAMLASTSYLRLSQLSLRYYLPSRWIEDFSHGIIKYASVAVRGSNLFTLTPYTDGSPEAGTVPVSVQPVLTLHCNVTF